MSQTYIPGIVDNIKSDSTPYSPIIEAITNAIDAINESGQTNGLISIDIERENILQDKDTDELPDILSVTIRDNGVGFNDKNRDSFDTVYSPKKKSIGGKGFGRFFYLHHFTSANVESYYINEDGDTEKRTFDFGQEYNVVVNEESSKVPTHETGTILRLKNIRKGKFDKHPEIFAHRILERLLSYFVDDTYTCPQITINDSELDQPIVLNELIGDSDESLIRQFDNGSFEVNDVQFKYKLFKLYRMRTQKSRIVLTARNQSVTDSMLETSVPEFASDFEEDYVDHEGKKINRKFIIRFYIQSNYLDEHVTTERDTFLFNGNVNQTSIYPVNGDDIERAVATIAKDNFEDEFKLRFENKKKRYESYATENIWYKPYIDDLDFESLKATPTKEELETVLHKAKYNKDLEIKRKIASITSGQKLHEDADMAAAKIIKEAKSASISDLAQYIAFRRAILELLNATIRYTADGTYKTEKELHDIIFPTNKSSDDVTYDGHNLWVIDERLTFSSQHISSDKNIFKGQNNDRPDIAVFHDKIAYREVNEESSPISIFEFKKPGRHDFVGKSSEDPVEQIIRYVQAIKKGELKTLEGVEVKLGDNTPFYGYIVADSDPAIRDWLVRKNFKPLPDADGWFLNHDGLNLYVEYITWQKLIKDAEIRHRKFFELLGAA